MKRFLLTIAACFCVTSGASAAPYVLAAMAEKSVSFIDIGTISRSLGNTKVWLLTVHLTDYEMKVGFNTETMAMLEFRCSQRESRVVFTVNYFHEEAPRSSSNSSSWVPIVPDSIAWDLFQRACNNIDMPQESIVAPTKEIAILAARDYQNN